MLKKTKQEQLKIMFMKTMSPETSMVLHFLLWNMSYKMIMNTSCNFK